MVHGSVRERDAFQQPSHAAYYQQPQPRAYPVSAAVAPTPLYAAHPQQVDYQYQRQRPQSPPSPPAEEQKPSLPSISSLLEFAGGDKPNSESAAYFMGASLNNMEPHQQRQALSSMPPLKRDSLPSHSMSPYSGSMYAQSPYQSSPGNASATSFYSPEQHSYNSAGMYAQRPLPSNYQPTMPMAMPQPSSSANGANPWQHHHYISTSSQSAFPQSQDRYICSTCNKAFSRPSSLRIHSHSHTGEKPYKCPQAGCGKAFSVRSNMKRHERGCHASTSTTITT
ncbi:hypothetical protein N0V95_005342 [Ascochyta clinopodiicola]|nr:hypothetical protein N0V95_005342 [Ascochyta clinopodiicola]